MMRRVCWLFFVVLTVGSLMLSPSLEAAKKKSSGAVPMKIIKASETPFKGANLVKEAPVKQKKFLWFKKKTNKTVEPRMAPIANQAVPQTVQRPAIEEPAKELLVLPEPKKKKMKVQDVPMQDSSKQLISNTVLDSGSVSQAGDQATSGDDVEVEGP